MPDSAFAQSLRLLATRRFGTFWFASFLSNIGTWSQQVAQPWLMLSLGASPFLLGLDSFAMGAPIFLLTMVGGAMADQFDRRRVIAGFQSVQMLCPVLIVVLILAGHIQPWMIIVLSLVVGITDALSMPSFQSIVPSIVPREQIASGIALNSTQFNLSRVIGPSLAGVLMLSVGAAGAFAVSATSYIPFILVALWVLPRGATVSAPDATFDRSQMAANVKEIGSDPVLRGALLTVLATSLLAVPLITFCPVLIRDAFGSDVTHYSLTMACFGAGGLAGATGLLAVDPERDRRAPCSLLAAGFGAIVMLAAANRWHWAVPALFALAGAAMTASNASANTLLQALAPARLRGQAVSLYMLAMRGGMAVGAFATGISVHFAGVREALFVNGLLAVGVQLLIGRAWRGAAMARPPA